jgi:hypothetical protein
MEAGKAIVKLTAEEDVCPKHPSQSRHGPSRHCRRERRAAEHEAVYAKVDPSKESKSEEGGKAVHEEDTRKPATEEVIDEDCPNDEYNKTKQNPTTTGSAGPGPPPSTSTRKPAFDYITYVDLLDLD